MFMGHQLAVKNRYEQLELPRFDYGRFRLVILEQTPLGSRVIPLGWARLAKALGAKGDIQSIGKALTSSFNVSTTQTKRRRSKTGHGYEYEVMQHPTNIERTYQS